jgi:hypothetical protein
LRILKWVCLFCSKKSRKKNMGVLIIDQIYMYICVVCVYLRACACVYVCIYYVLK